MISLVKPFLPPRKKLLERLEKTLYSGYIAEGEVNEEFQKVLSGFTDNPYCLTTNSGTSALHLSLILCGVKKDDEVISTALTAEPTNTTIALTGAKIVFSDVEYETGLISPKDIENKITERTKAIVIVHYAGMVCDMDKINNISQRTGIPVIEDNAHAFMAKYNNRYLGSNSRFNCFSFQAIKHMTTIDGGLICLKHFDDYERARKLRWFGLDKKIPRNLNNITEPGYKYHMNDVNATIGLCQIDYLHQNVLKYIENGQFFDENLKNIPGLKLIPYHKNTSPSYWLYTIKVQKRNKFIEHLNLHNIQASTLHKRSDYHEYFEQKEKSLPNLDKFYEEFVHIPVGWWVSEEDRNYIVEIIKQGW